MVNYILLGSQPVRTPPALRFDRHCCCGAPHSMIARGRVEHIARTADYGEVRSELPERCVHGEIVHQAERSSMTTPAAATPALTGTAEFEASLAKVQSGVLSAARVTSMRARATAAENEGIPLLVRLGNTGCFAVRDGQEFDGTAAGGWAHVKCDVSDGCGAARDRRNSNSRLPQCEVTKGPVLRVVTTHCCCRVQFSIVYSSHEMFYIDLSTRVDGLLPFFFVAGGF